MPARIAVLSDTHGLLRPEVLRIVRTCDCILHGGDINQPEILDELRTIAPLYVVRGNNDKYWAEDLPQSLSVTLEGVTFFMVHNKKDVPPELGAAQIVVFGHSHKYFEQELDGRLWLNPGSCGPPLFHLYHHHSDELVKPARAAAAGIEPQAAIQLLLKIFV